MAKKQETQNKKQAEKLKQVRVIVAICLVALLGIIVLIALLFSTSSNRSTGVELDHSPLSSEETLLFYDSMPEGYVGRTIATFARIEQIQRSEETNMLFVAFYLDGSGANAMVYVDDFGELTTDDYVWIEGEIMPDQKYTSMDGVERVAHVINATSIRKSSYIEGYSHPLWTKDYEATHSYGGADMTVTRIDFAENETRVFMRIVNNSGDDLSVYRSTIIQNGKQIDSVFAPREADYEELPTQVKSGATAEGVAVFPAMDQLPFTYIIEFSDLAWRYDVVKEFRYNFTLK